MGLAVPKKAVKFGAMWQSHLMSLLRRLWVLVLAWHSATTFSILRDVLLVPVFVALVTLRVKVGVGFWNPSVLKTRAGDIVMSMVISVVALVGLLGIVFLFAIPVTVYHDHQDLVAALRAAHPPKLEVAFTIPESHFNLPALGEYFTAKTTIRNDGPPTRVVVTSLIALLPDPADFHERRRLQEDFWKRLLLKAAAESDNLQTALSGSMIFTFVSDVATADVISKMNRGYVYYVGTIVRNEQGAILAESCRMSSDEPENPGLCLDHIR